MTISRVKGYLAHLLHSFRIFSLYHKYALQGRAIILMYHRVLPSNNQLTIPIQPGMYVSTKGFKIHLSYLASKFSIIPLEELVDRLKKDKDISNCCAITFDDGWLDNYTYAFPILRKLQVPTTIFLVSGYVGSYRWFWSEEVSWCLYASVRKSIHASLLPVDLRNVVFEIRSKGQGKMEVLVDKFLSQMKSWPMERRTEVVRKCMRLRQDTKLAKDRLLMNWEEVREMSQSELITFGSHTMSHALLDQLPVRLVREEIEGAIRVIEEKTGRPTDLFAYPNGNYNDSVIRVLNEVGVKAAVTTKRGYVQTASSMLKLPRIGVHEDVGSTSPLFEWRLFVQ